MTPGQLTTAAHLRALVAINAEKTTAARAAARNANAARAPGPRIAAPPARPRRGAAARAAAATHAAQRHDHPHLHLTRKRGAADRGRRISHRQDVERIQRARHFGRSRRADRRHRFDDRRLYPAMLMAPDAPPPKGRSVVHRVTAHLRSNLVGWVALFVALGGTGYAAASHAHSNTINACANKHTGQLSVRHGARCKRGQVKISWAKQGPKGPAGTSAIQAFGAVGATGIVNPNGGISVQHTGPGVFVVTATTPGCANGLNDPTATVTSPNPSNNPAAGSSAGPVDRRQRRHRPVHRTYGVDQRRLLHPG